MIKECIVKINNESVTVVDYDGISIQFPAINKDSKTVYVEYKNDKYKIVDKDAYDNMLKEIEKKSNKKKTTNKFVKESEDVIEENEDA